MIYTTYFANLRRIKETDNIVPISIARKPPIGWTGLEYKKLAPSYECMTKYKKDGNIKDYIQRYCKETLGVLNPDDAIFDMIRLLPNNKRELIDMINCPLWENPYVHIALVCFEKPEDFCHRHIDRLWFGDSNIRCNELLRTGRKCYEVDMDNIIWIGRKNHGS